KAASTLLKWALSGADPDTLEGRRRALESAAEAGDDPTRLALERFALELAWSGASRGGASGGDIAVARQSLDRGEEHAYGDLATAAALGRLLVLRTDQAALEQALERLDATGSEGAAIASAERFRVARTRRDRVQAAAHAGAWVRADPSLGAVVEWLSIAQA